jgi:hypothetical protein
MNKIKIFFKWLKYEIDIRKIKYKFKKNECAIDDNAAKERAEYELRKLNQFKSDYEFDTIRMFYKGQIIKINSNEIKCKAKVNDCYPLASGGYRIEATKI